MKLDTLKPGLTALMFPHNAALLKHLYSETDKFTHSRGLGSGYLSDWFNENAESLGMGKRSRACIINGLNDMAERGILKFVEVTGKGGLQKRYSVAMTTGQFEAFVREAFTEKLDSIFEGDWWRLP